MTPARKLVADTLGSAGRAARIVEQGASALLGVHVARALHGRWLRMSATEREQLEPLATDVKERALDLRGAGDPEAAGRDLAQAEERLAAAMVESAESDPDISEIEVGRLRDDLARELDRLAGAEIRASRGVIGKTAGGREPDGQQPEQ
ncbi:MAG: hypothetical protein ACR2GL_01085 [Thermoleophilaceae bacterium]